MKKITVFLDLIAVSAHLSGVSMVSCVCTVAATLNRQLLYGTALRVYQATMGI